MRDTTVLFDVDQTLLHSGGAGSLGMRRAFHELYSIEDGFGRVEFSGRTDSAILRAALQQHGLLDGRSEDFWPEVERFREAYYAQLARTLREAEGGRVMPGVRELLDALAGRDAMRVGLATGNFRRAAFMKIEHFGLGGYVDEGGFGDDAEERRAVVARAIKRVAGGSNAIGGSVWVIGDTVLDVEAARANRVRALGVATGGTTQDELRAAGADVVVADLSDTQAVLEVLAG